MSVLGNPGIGDDRRSTHGRGSGNERISDWNRLAGFDPACLCRHRLLDRNKHERPLARDLSLRLIPRASLAAEGFLPGKLIRIMVKFVRLCRGGVIESSSF